MLAACCSWGVCSVGHLKQASVCVGSDHVSAALVAALIAALVAALVAALISWHSRVPITLARTPERGGMMNVY